MPKSTALTALTLTLPLAVACGAGPTEDLGANAAALSTGEYLSRATSLANAPYIGNWENNWGYVLGYMAPGGRIYAQKVTGNSVYGLIEDAGYGAWDEGHHCGWVSLDGLTGSGTHSDVGDICPPWDSSFSLANGGQSPQLFKPGTVVVSNGEVQPAVVLPTCPDLTVYANYDPVTHTFSNPDGVERAGRGTMWTSSDPHCSTYGGVPQQRVTEGYCGFGTRFVSADGVAVEIKDTERDGRGGSVTSFGFMRSQCIAGSQVGNPSPMMQPPPPPPPPPLHCCALCKNRIDAYEATASSDCRTAAIDFCAINDRGGVSKWYEGDCAAAP